MLHSRVFATCMCGKCIGRLPLALLFGLGGLLRRVFFWLPLPWGSPLRRFPVRRNLPILHAPGGFADAKVLDLLGFERAPRMLLHGSLPLGKGHARRWRRAL